MLGLGSLGGPLGGLLADRLPRRALLATLDSAAAALVLLLLLVHGRGQLWLVYVVMFGYGIAGCALTPAQTALMRAIVPMRMLADANTALQTAKWGVRLVTPVLSAGLVPWAGPAPVVIGDAVTFMVGLAATIPALRTARQARSTQPAGMTQTTLRAPGRPPRPDRHWLSEAAAGALHIRRTDPLRRLALAGTLALAAFGLSESALFAAVRRGLHRPDAFLGVLVSAQGAGAVVAGAGCAALLRRLDEPRVAAAGTACAAAGFLLLVSSSTPAALTGAVLLGAGLPWIMAGLSTALQRHTPAGLMGRADAALGAMLSVPQTVAIAVGSALVAAVGYRMVLVIVVGLLAAAATYLVNHTDRATGTAGSAEIVASGEGPAPRRTEHSCTGGQLHERPALDADGCARSPRRRGHRNRGRPRALRGGGHPHGPRHVYRRWVR
jgi:MFS family permease